MAFEAFGEAVGMVCLAGGAGWAMRQWLWLDT